MELIRYRIFDRFKNLVHFTTTKLALDQIKSRFTKISEKAKQHNFSQLSEITGIEKHRFIFPIQTHSTNFKIIQSFSENEIQDTDALITSNPGICICVQTADCVPVFVYNPKKNIIAIIHAGWRGTVGKIVPKTINFIMDEFHSTPENFYIAMGPSIGPQVYEVGEDVISEVVKNIPSPETCLNFMTDPKALFDLCQANKNLLLKIGIKEENIEISPYCTYSDANLFYSARREGIKTGRLISGLIMNDKN